MKTLFFTIFLIALPIILLTSAACPDCVDNIDFTDKKSVISCVVTILFGLVVRYIERKKLKKQLKDTSKQEDDNK